MIRILGRKVHVQCVHICGVSRGSEWKWEKRREFWLAASSHFHFEQTCVKSLDGVPEDTVYLLSFKESHHMRTVMKSGAVIPFKEKQNYIYI